MTLSPSGKPMRALKALRDTTPDTAMSEGEVWQILPSTTPAWNTLAALVERGLAIRTDDYQTRWYITEAGRTLLAEEER